MKYVSKVYVSPDSLEMTEGSWYYKASARVEPSDATNPKIRWFSQNTDIASVNPTSGYIYAKAEGTTYICAAAEDGSGAYDCINVTVRKRVPVESVSFDFSRFKIRQGERQALTVTVCPENATDTRLTWSSSDTGVATVAGGVVTAVAHGRAVITATANDGSGKSASCTVTVMPLVPVTSIEVTPSTQLTLYEQTPNMHYYLLHVGKGVLFNANVLPENATDKTLNWASSNPAVAGVNNAVGYVYGNAPGDATIYVTAMDGSRVDKVVNIHVIIPAESVTLYHTYRALKPDETVRLSATVSPQNTSLKNVQWSSSDPSVATVSNTGLVTAKKDGVAVIRATAYGLEDAYANCTIRVDSREQVTVKKNFDGSYSYIEFADGRIWNCINQDVIYNYSKNLNDPLTQRCYENVYQTQVVDEQGIHRYYEPLKEYSDREIVLLYSLDPYGLAAYVQEYASQLSGRETGNQEKLSAELAYKDRIFRLLFESEPRYYKREFNGEWYETTDKSNLLAVASESEFLFGGHPLWDQAVLASFIKLLGNVISTAIGLSALSDKKSINWIDTAYKYCSMGISVTKSILDRDFAGFIYALSAGLIDDKKLNESIVIPAKYQSQNFSVSWIFSLLSFSSDLKALGEVFRSGPHFYKEVFTHCNSDLNYNILIRTTDNVLISLADIRRAIS